jgi:hypothetical protein
MKKSLILLLFIPVLFWGCPEIQQVSPIPEIKYVSFKFVEGSSSEVGGYPYGELKFSFIDGDADLGVYEVVDTSLALPDSVKHGIFINLFEKINGVYYERFPTYEVHTKDTIVQGNSIIIRDSTYLDTISFNRYLPYDEKLNRSGQNKTVKGKITVQIPFEKIPDYDSMRFEFYIRDRALHKSNVEVTPDFSKYDIPTTSL